MAPPNKILLPDNLDREIGDLRRRIVALETAGSQPSPLVYNESVDAAHPMYLDFVIASGVQPTIAKLSFKLRLYRTTSSFAGGATGSGNGAGTGAGSSHNHGSAASVAHTHHNSPTVGAGGAALSINGSTLNMASGPNSGWDTDSTTPGNPGATGSEASHTHTEGSHTHPVGASSLGVSEGTATTITAIGVDGVDKTALLGGGPWIADTVDLDVSKVLPLGDGLWHYIQLTTAGQGRIVAELKLSA